LALTTGGESGVRACTIIFDSDDALGSPPMFVFWFVLGLPGCCYIR
jgi:hypothetical protein